MFFRVVGDFAKDLASEVKDDLAGLKRGLEAEIGYQQLLKKLKSPKGNTLTEKKLYALTECKKYIPDFTNHAATDFFKKLHVEAELQYIREEKGFFKLFGEHGNTKTYKKIVGLLKARVIENYTRHTDAENRDFADNLAEERNVDELMKSRRGRIPNLFAEGEINFGYTGSYNKEYEKRRMLNKG